MTGLLTVEYCVTVNVTVYCDCDSGSVTIDSIDDASMTLCNSFKLICTDHPVTVHVLLRDTQISLRLGYSRIDSTEIIENCRL